MNFLFFSIPTNPEGKKRSRRGKFGNWYNPSSDSQNEFKRLVQKRLPENFKPIKKGLPVHLDVCWFLMPSKTEQKKKDFSKDDIPCTKKPDRDNLDKFVMDSLNKLIFYDDAQVCSGFLSKIYSLNPRVEFTVRW